MRLFDESLVVSVFKEDTQCGVIAIESIARNLKEGWKLCNHLVFLLWREQGGISCAIFIVPSNRLKFENVKHCEGGGSHVVDQESINICIIVPVTDVGKDPNCDIRLLLISFDHAHQEVCSISK